MATSKGPNPWRHATAGLELVGVLLVFIGLGFVLDRWLGSSPWGVLTGSVIGIVGGLIRLVRDAWPTNLPPTRRRPPADSSHPEPEESDKDERRS